MSLPPPCFSIISLSLSPPQRLPLGIPIKIAIIHIYLVDELWIANLFSGSDIPCKVHEISGRGNVGPVWYVKNAESERVIVWSCDVHKRNFSKGYFDTFGDICELWRKVICKKNGLKRLNLHPNYFSWIYSGTSSLDTFVQGKPPFRGLKIWFRKNLQFAVVTFTEGTPLFRVRDTFPQGP